MVVLFFVFFSTFVQSVKYSPFVSHVPYLPEDEIVISNQEFEKDPSPLKINLGIGEYLDEYGKPWVPSSIRKVQLLLNNKTFAHEYYESTNQTSAEPSDLLFNENYLPISGLSLLTKEIEKMIFGETCDSSLIYSMHTTSSTGAFRLSLQFLEEFVDFSSLAVSDPDFPNYSEIAEQVCPEKKILTYRYLKRYSNGSSAGVLDFEGMLEDLKTKLPDRSVVILQANCHNPTGLDLTNEQWSQVIEVFQNKPLYPIIDAAYLGFSSGDPYLDSVPIQLFQQSGIEFTVAVSFSKNMGIYGERVGSFHIQVRNEDLMKNLTSQLTGMIQRLYFSPPAFGGRLAYFVMKDFRNQWKNDVRSMVHRMNEMRNQLVSKIENADWSFVNQQKGFYVFSGLTLNQVKFLKEKFHIYLVPDGRLCITGLNTKNINYISKAINEALLIK